MIKFKTPVDLLISGFFWLTIILFFIGLALNQIEVKPFLPINCQNTNIKKLLFEWQIIFAHILTVISIAINILFFSKFFRLIKYNGSLKLGTRIITAALLILLATLLIHGVFIFDDQCLHPKGSSFIRYLTYTIGINVINVSIFLSSFILIDTIKGILK